MASRVRVFDCPACGASEFVLRVGELPQPPCTVKGCRDHSCSHPRPAGLFGPAHSTSIACAECGHIACHVRGLGLEPGTAVACRAITIALPESVPS